MHLNDVPNPRRVITRRTQEVFPAEAYREKNGLKRQGEGSVRYGGETTDYGTFDGLRDPKRTFQNRQRGLMDTHHLR